MNKKNQLKALMGTLSLLLVAVVISCTRNLSVPVTAIVLTPTPSFTGTVAVANTATSTFTGTFSATPLFSSTNTPTSTVTNTTTNTGTATFTSTFTNTATMTPTNTTCNVAGNTCTFTGTPTFTNTATVTDTYTPTSTATNTCTATASATFTNTPLAPPTATPVTNEVWDDFDEFPWVDTPAWSGTGGNGYLVSVFMIQGTWNTSTVSATAQGGSQSLDVNFSITTAAGDLVEATIEGAGIGAFGYGACDTYQYNGGTPYQGSGVNPSYVSYWIYPVQTAMVTDRVYMDLCGANTAIPQTPQTLPAGVWTNVVTAIPGTMGPLSNLKAVIIDLTCPVTGGPYDVLYDSICFYQ